MEYKIQPGFEFGSMRVIEAVPGDAYSRAWKVQCECGHVHHVKRLNFNKWRHTKVCHCGARPTFKPTKWVASPTSTMSDCP